MNKSEVYLLSGFLGSGKTTLLKNLLQQERLDGRRAAVLMNELGSVSIDSDAVNEDVPLKELLDGCICCTISDKLEAQLQSLLIENNPDVIYIEATGAAHPVEVLDAIVSPLFADRIDFKGIITTVDSKRWLERKKLSPQIQLLLVEQVKHANLLLINKTDTLNEEQQANVSMEISLLNPHAFTILTSFAKVPTNHVRKMGYKKDLLQHRVKVDLQLRTFVYHFKHHIRQEDFENFLREIPETIYRIKGYVRFSENSYPYLFQYSYGMPLYMKEYMNMPLNLVFIGENIDWTVLNDMLSDLEEKQSRKIDK
ncbi:GTP-binding protein [Niallia oryzisoli]|uniref:GTP-binding protein n=1 Tax=Niallia oryzisoli TaxID=1737571 RepID=A0ABZ2C7K2_9BACI